LLENGDFSFFFILDCFDNLTHWIFFSLWHTHTEEEGTAEK
jgi:hypothetical protein